MGSGSEFWKNQPLITKKVFSPILISWAVGYMAGIAVHKLSLCFVRTDQWAYGQQCMEVRKAIILA